MNKQELKELRDKIYDIQETLEDLTEEVNSLAGKTRTHWLNAPTELTEPTLQLVNAKFPNNSKYYTYYAPIHTKVGDVIDTPTGLATVMSIVSGGTYKGTITTITTIYKKS